MKLNVKLLPWFLALTGLAVPLVVSRLMVWPVILAWVLVPALLWTVNRMVPTTSAQRIAIGTLALPVLFLLVWEGGWFLIPADLAWLLIEISNRAKLKPAASARL